MITARDIYAQYDIMPNLQLHQLRVAAVAKLICENFDPPAGRPNARDVILACLFHDMGNIIKSDLSHFPEFRAERGLAYWERVKADFVEKYGADAHRANVAIAREIGLPKEAIRYIDGISFSNMENIVASGSFEQKIAEYGDLRAGPHGIMTLLDRLQEARKRYLDSGKTYYSEEGFLKLSASAVELERQVFAHAGIAPTDITDEAIAGSVEELADYPVDIPNKMS